LLLGVHTIEGGVNQGRLLLQQHDQNNEQQLNDKIHQVLDSNYGSLSNLDQERF